MFNKVYILDDNKTEYNRILEKLKKHKELSLDIVSDFISPVDNHNSGQFKAEHFKKIKEFKPDIIIIDYDLPENEIGIVYIDELIKENLDFLFFPIHISQNKEEELTNTISTKFIKRETDGYLFCLKSYFYNNDIKILISNAQNWLKLNYNIISIDKIASYVNVKAKPILDTESLATSYEKVINYFSYESNSLISQEIKIDEIILITTGNKIKLNDVTKYSKKIDLMTFVEDKDYHLIFTKDCICFRKGKGNFEKFFSSNFQGINKFKKAGRFHYINIDYFEKTSETNFIFKENIFDAVLFNYIKFEMPNFEI